MERTTTTKFTRMHTTETLNKNVTVLNGTVACVLGLVLMHYGARGRETEMHQSHVLHSFY